MKLGIYSYHARSLIGTIQLSNNQIIGSNEGVQSIINSQLIRADGDVDQAFQALKNWSNGYLWIKPINPENEPH